MSSSSTSLATRSFRLTNSARQSLEADLQNSTIGTHQPSGFGSGKGYRPVAAHTRQREPGISLIGSPSRASVVGGDHHGAAVAAVVVVVLVVVAVVVSGAATSP